MSTEYVDGLCCDISDYASMTLHFDPHRVMQNDEIVFHATNMLAALSDGTRLRILLYLLNGRASVTTIVEHCKVSQSAISHQLRLLRERGLVRAEREGRTIWYELDDLHIRALLIQTIEHALHLHKEVEL